MLKNNHKSSAPPGKRKLGLFLLTPLMAAMLIPDADAATQIKATSKYKNKTGTLEIAGRLKGATPGSQVSVFDASNDQILYSVKTDSKNKFKISLAADKTDFCALGIKAGDTVKPLSIRGADKSCKKAPTCAIAEGDQTITASGNVKLSVNAGKTAKKDPLTFSWHISDQVPSFKASAGSATPYTGNTLEHEFNYPGLYQVKLNGSNSTGSCSDNIMVSVAPTSAPPTVDALAANAKGKTPAAATALNAPENAYVVLPFEETGMQGGSQVNLPYNPLIPYNALNAQVIQKLPQKPPLVSDAVVELYYSAGVNPTDPVTDSINSTSQNWFGGNKIGSNVDYDGSQYDPKSLAPTANAFINDQDFLDATVRKTEQWDRLYQKNQPANAQTGIDMAWQQARFSPAKPMAKPDEGIRGYVDNGEGVRAMPGISNPYVENNPQPIPFNAGQDAFTAQFIPATNVDDKGRVNPYPVMRVEAKADGATVAATDTVYTTASETRCRECHLPGGIAADDEVWRTPVTENELELANGDPGPATGAGSFPPGLDAKKAWPPAIHNRFDDTFVDNTSYSNLGPAGQAIPRHTDTNIRKDRVKAVRWVKLDAAGNATSETSDTKPADMTGWTVQIQLKFKSGADYGNADDPMAQEKAAIFNTLVMHDYMVFYGPTPSEGKTWPTKPSSQLADYYSDDDVGSSAARPQYFCSGHHQSQFKFDIGIGGKSPATNRSDYSRAFHAFHGKMQVYASGPQKGQLIRDSRGHPKMYGGRGWDSQMDDDNGIPLVQQADNTFADNSGLKGTDPSTWDSDKFKVPTWDPAKNNWRPDLFGMDPNGELMLPFGDKVAMEDNCASCHTGKTEKAYRDIHHAAGLKCESCHGDMLAVGNVFPNEGYDQNLMWAGAMGADTTNAYKPMTSLENAVYNLGMSEPADFRRPWLDMPDCGSCHFGDANIKTTDSQFFSVGALKQAWKEGDRSGLSMMPENARFAVMPTKEERPENTGSGYVAQPLSQALYRKSGDVHGTGANGTLTCSTCHGGSHSIWPNPDPNANDNVTAKQLQGYDGNIAECSVCHVKDDFKTGLVADSGQQVHGQYLGVAQGYRGDATVVPDVDDASQRAFLAGPHGMHPVGDESWWKTAEGVKVDDFKTKTVKGVVLNGGWHSDMTYKPGPDGEDQCAACHGADHKGTRLSKTLVAREFVSDKGKKIRVEAGQPIGCDLCHAMKKSFKRAPLSKKEGYWPPAQMHMPPMPESITPGAPTGGGGGHG